MVKEKRIEGNVISRKFSTMLPLDVFADLTRFAKRYSGTGLGKFDYGVALRLLLERNNFMERIEALEEYVENLKEMIQSKPQETPKETKSITFGTKSEEVKNE